jgi:hypothetical protein
MRMSHKTLPRFPVYIPSKGRALKCLTARCLVKDGCPFKLVVEPQEFKAYASEYGAENCLKLPFRDLGQGSIPARNWIKAHATEAGHKRHWQLDDNMTYFERRWKSRRIPCDAGLALNLVEEFTERYTNIAISGLNYEMFLRNGMKAPPFYLNSKVYSASLVLNSLTQKWRGRYNEDADLCLQVLAAGLCTVLFNCVLVFKIRTGVMEGGNTAQLYKGDGRARMARSLQRQWPMVVETKRRFQRPQHVVKAAWTKFDTPLIRRSDIDWEALEGTTDEHGMGLAQVSDIKSDHVQHLLGSWADE